MPSNRIIKRAGLCTKYNFDIWGSASGNTKFLGLINRLYLSPRFMKEVEHGLKRYKQVAKMQRLLNRYKFTRWYWRYWKAHTYKVLQFQDPYPVYDRPKNMTQVYKKRTMHNFMILKNLRLRIYLGYKKEYQYRQYLATTRRTFCENHTDAMTRTLECRLSHLLLRAGFAKNMEISRALIINGYIRVNNQIITNPAFLVSISSITRLVLPEYLEKSELRDDLVFTYQRTSFPAYFIVNWKLMSIRFAGSINSRRFSHPHFNLKANDVSFFYSAL